MKLQNTLRNIINIGLASSYNKTSQAFCQIEAFASAKPQYGKLFLIFSKFVLSAPHTGRYN